MKKLIIAVVLCLLVLPTWCFGFEVGDRVETTERYEEAMRPPKGSYFSGKIIRLVDAGYDNLLATIQDECGETRESISTFWLQYDRDKSYQSCCCRWIKWGCKTGCNTTTTSTTPKLYGVVEEEFYWGCSGRAQEYEEIKYFDTIAEVNDYIKNKSGDFRVFGLKEEKVEDKQIMVPKDIKLINP